MRKIILLFIVLTPLFTFAQDITGGVRLGLNINRITGPSETSINSQNLETFDNNTGFLVGGLLDVGFTDFFGLRGEFLFSQKGGRLLYKGESTQVFNPETTEEVIVIGTRNSVIRINNAYIDIPIMAYIRPIPKLKILGGLSFGFLVSSQGFGELDFSGISAIGQVPIDFVVTLDHNYGKDEGFATANLGDAPLEFSADGSTFNVPQTAGAYVLDYEEKGIEPYNAFDLGVIGGLAYYLNSSLFFSAMVNTSLGDITKSEKDLTRSGLDENNKRIFRDDVDRNLSIQLSLGFQF